ncbi:MAG: peptidoglycan DD-metalloendopeptidase family protein [Rhizobiales bacterium]|nr:peptidoglycan DD-metalloendopeptidase family protein [Hyphomicrobiales bacterium]
MSYRSGYSDQRRDSGRYVEGWGQRSTPAHVYGPPHHAPQSHAPSPQNHGHGGHHPHAQQAHTHPRTHKVGAYTLAHGGRQVRIGPIAFWIVVGTLIIMAGWSVLTGTYFAFHDDVLKRLIARQAQMQFAYEDRIAELRVQVDRVTSRQLLDQEQFERKLDHLVQRQQTLEQRTSALTAIPDMMPTGSIRQPARGTHPGENTKPKPSPINDTVIFVAPPDREARLESRSFASTLNRFAGVRTTGGVQGVLARLQDSIEHAEARQSATLSAIEESFDAKARRMKGVLADLGLDPTKAMPPAAGGPFVPAAVAPATPEASFERQLYRIKLARSNVDRLARAFGAVPVRKPVFGEIDMSSGFGMRIDPFVRAPAMHTGMDFRGDTGDPVRATATGTITTAGPSGGYGKMVEIDHANGFSTRFGHLSAIEVSVGQQVKIGQIIGRIGTTGRSTGPHLHYETRVDGDAVDPQKFLRAGIRLGNAI